MTLSESSKKRPAAEGPVSSPPKRATHGASGIGVGAGAGGGGGGPQCSCRGAAHGVHDDASCCANELYATGVSVFRLMDPKEAAELWAVLSNMDLPMFIKGPPERPLSVRLRGVGGSDGKGGKKDIDSTVAGAGGFSALGAGAHAPEMRRARAIIWRAMRRVLAHYAKKHDHAAILTHAMMLFDRLMFRPAGVSATAESVHRDVSPVVEDAANRLFQIVFGGWLSMSEGQTFSCVPGSMTDGSSPSAGFTRFTDPAVVMFFKENRQSIAVPPGCIVIFRNDILHEVVGNKKAIDTLRLFSSYCLTSGPELFPQTTEWMDRQLTPLLPSGQQQPLWPKLWPVNWQERLAAWTLACVKPEFRATIKRFITDPPRPEDLYEPYTGAQRAIMLPHPLPEV